MARRRAAQGAYGYRARTTASAARVKRGPSPASKAGRRLARVAERRAGKLPAPGTVAAGRLRNRFLPDNDETRFLQRAALDETLAGGRGEYAAELAALGERGYRSAYNAQQRGRRAAAPKKATAKSRVRVRAHWRGVAHR